MAQIGIDTLEEATAIVAGTLEGGTPYYREHNAVVVEYRMIAAEAAQA
jgi:hypothetical protein